MKFDFQIKKNLKSSFKLFVKMYKTVEKIKWKKF